MSAFRRAYIRAALTFILISSLTLAASNGALPVLTDIIQSVSERDTNKNQKKKKINVEAHKKQI